MTQEDKQLLLKDLCARLPYGVRVYSIYPPLLEWRDGLLHGISIENKMYEFEVEFFNRFKYHGWSDIESIKPYLRPMSSMTEKERQSYYKLLDNLAYADGSFYTPDIFDWLTARHFDYRGLIEKGFALEAPEGMYKTE